MDGDFSWLWRNEELSDFTLVIREVHRAAAAAEPTAEAATAEAAAADEDEGHIQTRAGKRRRTSGPPVSGADATRTSARRRGSQQQQQEQAPTPLKRSNEQQQRQGQQQQQQQDALQNGQQQEAAAADGAQLAAGRATRRSTRQQQQRQQSEEREPQPRQRQQQQQHNATPSAHGSRQAAEAAAAAAAGTAPLAAGRRTRRSNAGTQHTPNAQHQAPTDTPALAAAAAGDAAAGDEDGEPHAHRHHAPAAAAAAASDEAQHRQGDGPPGGRKTRSSRSKKRAADTAAGAGGTGAGARTRAVQQQQQQEREQQAQQQQQGHQDAGGHAVTRRSLRRQQMQQSVQQLQQSLQQLTTGRGHGTEAPSSGPQQQQLVPAAAGPAAAAAAAALEIRVPVHAVVLAGFSEYFKALICSWSGNLNRTLTLDVGEDEGSAALLMVEFMYTGKLPDASPEELLKMVRLADQYQVSRFMAAASSSFESLPLSNITQGVMLEVFRLPQLMLDAPEMSRVLSKARSKLLDLYGDLEKVWACEPLREQFLALPFPAVRCLLSSEATAVATENTVLVALTGWVEEGPHGRRATASQRKDLLNLIRLPYLTSSFVGDILNAVPWIREALENRQSVLLNAFQFAIASESTRQRLASYDYGPSSLTPHYRCPRPTSSVGRASFEWSIELSTIKRMVADAKLWGRVVELSSPLHYFAGFWWQLLFNVEKTPTPPDAPADVAAAPATVVEFVGVRCHVNCGAHDYYPRVVRFKATIAALQTGFWEMDYAYMKAIEGPIVDGVGLGYPGFFALPGQALESEAAWSRFVRGGRVQLRCEVTDCE